MMAPIVKCYGIASVGWRDFVFVMGGGEVTGTPTDRFNIIDAKTHAVLVPQDRLSYAISDAAPIIINDKIYLFNGYGSSSRDRWQTYTM